MNLNNTYLIAVTGNLHLSLAGSQEKIRYSAHRYVFTDSEHSFKQVIQFEATIKMIFINSTEENTSNKIINRIEHCAAD